MKKLVMVVMFLFAGVAFANVDTPPVMEFDADSCTVFVAPKDGNIIDGWYIAVVNDQYAGVHNINENFKCDREIEILPYVKMDLAKYDVECGIFIDEVVTNIPPEPTPIFNGCSVKFSPVNNESLGYWWFGIKDNSIELFYHPNITIFNHDFVAILKATNKYQDISGYVDNCDVTSMEEVSFGSVKSLFQ